MRLIMHDYGLESVAMTTTTHWSPCRCIGCFPYACVLYGTLLSLIAKTRFWLILRMTGISFGSLATESWSQYYYRLILIYTIIPCSHIARHTCRQGIQVAYGYLHGRSIEMPMIISIIWALCVCMHRTHMHRILPLSVRKPMLSVHTGVNLSDGSRH